MGSGDASSARKAMAKRDNAKAGDRAEAEGCSGETESGKLRVRNFWLGAGGESVLRFNV